MPAENQGAKASRGQRRRPSPKPTPIQGAVDQAIAPVTRKPMSPDLMTVDELAGMLGLSRHGLSDAIGRNEVPGIIRIGRRIRVSRRVIERWLHGGAADEEAG